MTDALRIVREDEQVVKLSLTAAKGLTERIAELDAANQKLIEENDRIEDAKLMGELRMSKALAELDQRTKLRLSLLERRVMALETALDRVNNHAMTLATSEEVERLRERVYFIEGRTSV